MPATSPLIHGDPEILGGIPVFSGTRVPLRALFDHLEAGDSLNVFLENFPSVTREHAVAALQRAGRLLESDRGPKVRPRKLRFPLWIICLLIAVAAVGLSIFKANARREAQYLDAYQRQMQQRFDMGIERSRQAAIEASRSWEKSHQRVEGRIEAGPKETRPE